MNRAERRALRAQSRKGTPEMMRLYVHEAGHAVIALVNGIEVRSARAERKPIGGGRENLDGLVEVPPITDADLADRPRLWKELKIILAGDLAESIAFGDSLAERGVAIDHDFPKARGMILGALGTPESALTETAEAAMNEVDVELRANWRAVEALAAALLDRRRLTGEEVREIVTSAVEGAPPG